MAIKAQTRHGRISVTMRSLTNIDADVGTDLEMGEVREFYSLVVLTYATRSKGHSYCMIFDRQIKSQGNP
jgi:hypothetical protein